MSFNYASIVEVFANDDRRETFLEREGRDLPADKVNDIVFLNEKRHCAITARFQQSNFQGESGTSALVLKPGG